MEVLIMIPLWLIFLALTVVVIRYAIDSSKSSRKLDVLTDEIRKLRKETRDNKHIIDKKV
ncbi:hypothetical protein SAMN05661091_1797 [Paenibacillus uliginis N3/975]|uniref:Uncharacterized protein n=1 Tax=Paenibacillus uliginis N3/975 TaxID=1313296 RepID=A0A1X7H5S4_9BACL|nr:hypothetical protein SAMN05661091_1797 [Paenibacillus uliginis N3/975]